MQIGFMRAVWRDHSDLDANMIDVLAVMATYADQDGTCWPAQGTLATKLKRSRPWVNAVLAKLESLGILTKERRHHRNGGERSCRYRLARHDGVFDRAKGLTEGVSPGPTTTTKAITDNISTDKNPPEDVPNISQATEVAAGFVVMTPQT
jgi:hypothetical protein